MLPDAYTGEGQRPTRRPATCAVQFLAQRVLRSLTLALDDPAVSLEDKTATLLAAERATLAAVSGMLAIWAADNATGTTSDDPRLTSD